MRAMMGPRRGAAELGAATSGSSDRVRPNLELATSVPSTADYARYWTR